MRRSSIHRSCTSRWDSCVPGPLPGLGEGRDLADPLKPLSGSAAGWALNPVRLSASKQNIALRSFTQVDDAIREKQNAPYYQ